MASFGVADAAVTMRNAVFRLVLARAAPALDNPADRDELALAEAFGGIAFDLLEPDQRARTESRGSTGNSRGRLGAAEADWEQARPTGTGASQSEQARLSWGVVG